MSKCNFDCYHCQDICLDLCETCDDYYDDDEEEEDE